MLTLEILDELMLKDITSGADAPRASRGRRIQTKYRGVVYRTAKERNLTLVFDCRDPLGSGRWHEVRIQLPSYKEISRQKNIDYLEKLELAMNAGDLKVYCPCEDFLYHGYKYMSWNLDYGLRAELRFPKIRNPKLKGSCCKHVLSTLFKLNLFGVPISRDLNLGKSTNYRNKLR